MSTRTVWRVAAVVVAVAVVAIWLFASTPAGAVAPAGSAPVAAAGEARAEEAAQPEPVTTVPETGLVPASTESGGDVALLWLGTALALLVATLAVLSLARLLPWQAREREMRLRTRINR